MIQVDRRLTRCGPNRAIRGVGALCGARSRFFAPKRLTGDRSALAVR